MSELINRVEDPDEQRFIDRNGFIVELPRSNGDFLCELCRRPIKGLIFGETIYCGDDEDVASFEEYHGCVCWSCVDSLEYGLATRDLLLAGCYGVPALPFQWDDETLLAKLLELRITPWREGETMTWKW